MGFTKREVLPNLRSGFYLLDQFALWGLSHNESIFQPNLIHMNA